MRKAFIRSIARTAMAVCAAGLVATSAGASNGGQPAPPADTACASGGGSPCSIRVASSTIDAAFFRLRELRRSGEVVLLDRALSELATSEELFADLRTPAEVIWSTLLGSHFDVGMTPRERAEAIERWRAARPGSPFLVLLEAMKLQHAANQAVASTLPEARQLAQARLAQAEALLLAMPPQAQATAIWHMMMLAVTEHLEQRTASEAAVFEAAVQRWPRHLPFYALMLQRLHPDRGGSWAAVERLAAEASRRTAATDGEAIYARLYARLPHDVAAGRTALDWPRLDRGFRDWLARSPEPRVRNLHASHACAARDRRAFLAAMRALDPADLAPAAWLPGHGHEACARWAGH